MDSVESALRFLQRSFASAANEEAQWREEKAQLQAQVRELERERSVQEEAYRDALIRVKMLEFALRQERGRYLVSPAPVSTSLHVSTSNSNSGVGLRKGERSDISRSMVSATVSRTIERSPSSSDTSADLHTQIYRNDSGSQKSSTPLASKEITRPRIGSKPSPSDTKQVELQPVKGSFRPLKLKVKMVGHMDGVRSLAFHPTEPILVSGSEDCTVRVWNLGQVTNGPPSQRTNELESPLTVRCHTQAVLAVALINGDNYPNNTSGRPGAFASSGRDGSICLFNLPPVDQEKVEPYTFEDYSSLKVHTVNRAHEDAIWDLHAHPLTNVLFSAGADGIVRTWGLTSQLALKSELRCTTKNHPRATGHNSRGVLIPTSVHTVLSDSKTCVVGYTNGGIAQFDFHGEQLVQFVRPTDTEGFGATSRDAQVNCIISHPTMPISITAHQDRKIRIFDMRAGDCVATMVAHQDSVSSLSIDGGGLYIASGSHDGSIRIWSVAERQCVFEQSAHRPKWAEAVHAVTYHPSRNFVATSGADGLIKIFQ